MAVATDRVHRLSEHRSVIRTVRLNPDGGATVCSVCTGSLVLADAEVGAAVGYEDPTFFRKLFKRATGVAPSRYRQSWQRIRAA